MLHDACHLCLLVTVDACQFSVLVTSTHLSPQDTLSLVHACSGHMLPLDNFNLPLYSTQEIFWYCRDCPGFEPGTTGFAAWCSTTEPPQPQPILSNFCPLVLLLMDSRLTSVRVLRLYAFFKCRCVSRMLPENNFQRSWFRVFAHRICIFTSRSLSHL